MKLYRPGSLLLTAVFVLAASVPALAGEAGKTEESAQRPVLDITSLSTYMNDRAELKTEKHLSFKRLVHKSLFMNDREAQRFEQTWNASVTRDRLGMSFVGPAERDDNPDRALRLELAAKEETYKFMSKMFFTLKPLADLRDALEPLSRPVEVYKKSDGTIATGFFVGPNRPVTEGGGEKAMGLRLWVSPSHNINAMVDVGSNLKISFLDGGVVDVRLISSDGTRFLGVRESGSDSAVLILGFGF